MHKANLEMDAGCSREESDEVYFEQTLRYRTIADILFDPAEGRSDQKAVTFYEGGACSARYSYGDIRKSVEAAMAGLARDLGVRKGDRVLVRMGNGPDAIVAHLSIMCLGAITVPVSHSESERVLDFIVRVCSPKAIIGLRGDEAPKGVGCPTCDVGTLIGAGSGTRSKRIEGGGVTPADPAVILFTSGTTSHPKGVCLSHRNLVANAHALEQAHELTRQDTNMCVLPLYHANAFGLSMIATLYSGSHVVLCDQLPLFNIWSIIEAERVRFVSVVPEILRILTRRGVADAGPPSLAYVVCAAAPLSREVHRQFVEATGVPVHQGYGQSECVNFALAVRHDIDPELLESISSRWNVPSAGTDLPGCRVAIRNPDGSLAAAEQEGDITVRGRGVMLGYWEAPDDTREVLGQGWLSTGDIGFFIEVEGVKFYFITGRRKEVIIRQGENVSPLAVEAELAGLAPLRFAAVGFENVAAGQEIGLYLEDLDGQVDISSIRTHVSRCALQYRPRVVIRGKSPIPRTSTGKVRRAELARKFTEFRGHHLPTDPVIVERD